MRSIQFVLAVLFLALVGSPVAASARPLSDPPLLRPAHSVRFHARRHHRRHKIRRAKRHVRRHLRNL